MNFTTWIVLLVAFFVEETQGFFGGGDKVRLSDLNTLTLYNGRMTTGRRSSPVKQIQCTGGSAGCSAFTPQVVQCYNRGSDGYDVQWECKSDMDNSYRFGSIEVSCEGYDHPEDSYVLKGSCGLEYTLDLTKEGMHSKGNQHNYYGSNSGSYGNSNYGSSSGGIGDWIMLAIVGVIIYGLYRTCIATSNTDSDYPDDGSQSGGNRWGQQRGNGGVGGGGGGYSSSPGNGGYPGGGCSGTRGSTHTGATGGGVGGGGFWSGAAAGGLLGYMFGNRGGGYGGYGRQGYGYGRRTGFGGSGFGGSRSSWGGGSGFGGGGGGGFSSGTRTASGFGGTRRR